MKSRSKKQPVLDRRQFHRRTVLGTASLVAAANLGFAAPKKASRYVDMHTHLGQTWNSTETLSAEQLLRWMDAHDIVQAVVFTLLTIVYISMAVEEHGDHDAEHGAAH